MDLNGWSFVPGPLSDPPRSSLDQYEMIEHPPETIADTILAYPGMRLVHPATPSWWEWKASWEDGNRRIDLNLTLFEIEPPAWGGSQLTVFCGGREILDLWMYLRASHPAIWLHGPDCSIYTPDAFLELIG